jgi:hypothetical protein
LWLFYRFEKKGWLSDAEIISNLRKADCLFTLISIRHGELHSDDSDHSSSVVGRNTLNKVVSELKTKSSVRLSEYAHMKDNDNSRYFKNPFGGLGQYYFGVLQDLKLMSGSSVKHGKLVKETGGRIAQALDRSVPSEEFLNVLETDTVSLTVLDSLSKFCHCYLKHSDEEAKLLMAVLRAGWKAITNASNNVSSSADIITSMNRSRSLGLLLELARVCASANEVFSIEKFRGMIYCGVDSLQKNIDLKPKLYDVFNCWKIYQRNEVLSIAIQGLFYVVLKSAELEQKSRTVNFTDTIDLARWFWNDGVGANVLSEFGKEKLSLLLDMRFSEI